MPAMAGQTGARAGLVGWRRLLATRAHCWQSLDLRAWSERTVIALVMQSHDNSLTLSAKKGLFGTPLGEPAGPWSAKPDMVADRP